MIAAMQRTTVPRTAAARPALAPRARASRRTSVRVAASAQVDGNKPGIAKFADSIGLPTDEGIFGFKPFAEQWTGRLAMMGFVISIVEEAMGNGGTLQQIGIQTPSTTVLGLLLGVAGTATLVGTANTAYKLFARKMTPGDISRYKNFLGLNNPNDFMAAAAAMKKQGDFTNLRDDAQAIAAVRSEGMAADKVLAINTVEEGAAAASELKAQDGSVLTLTKADEAQQVAAAAAESKAAAAPTGPSVSLSARNDIMEQGMFTANAEMAYARNIELQNGRAAMLGFLAAVVVEAATGKGILMQLIMWFKLMGLLGAESGF